VAGLGCAFGEVCAILMSMHPEIRRFALGDFFDQIWYLRQYGVALE
jgi:hypothetical protein